MPRFLLCCCCRKRRRDRYFDEAREKLSEDLDVAKIMRRMRFVEKSLSYLLPPDAITEIQDRTKFVILGLDSESEDEEDMIMRRDMIPMIELSRSPEIRHDNIDSSQVDDSNARLVHPN